MKYENVDISELLNQTLNMGIFSKTLIKNEHTQVTYMEMAPGEELTEHTSRYAATLHFLSGNGKMKLGDEMQEVHGHSLIHLPPHLSHTVEAENNLCFMIYMHKS